MKIIGIDTYGKCIICKEEKSDLLVHFKTGKTHKYICAYCVGMMYGALLMHIEIQKDFSQPGINFPSIKVTYGTGNFPPFNIPTTGDPLPETFSTTWTS